MQDGLKTFANYCMGCHGAQYQRYERVATDLGIPEEVMMDNIVFTDAKFGDHMKIGMKPEDAKVWFGAAPPDLTLVARVRGNDWLYTYMRSFYEDPARPYGVNNSVFPMLVCRMFWLRSRVAGLSDVSRSKWSRMAASSSIR